MKTKKEQKTLKKERFPVKRGLMKRQSTQKTKREKSEHIRTFEFGI